MALRYVENVRSATSDSMTGTTGGIFFGLQGNDTFNHASGSVLVVYMGGSGDDHYNMGFGSGLMTVAETSGGADRITAMGLGVNSSTTYFATIDGRHLYAFDTATGQSVLQVDWQAPAHRIESITLRDGTFSFDQIVGFMQASPHNLGDYTWDRAISSGLIALPDGVSGSDVNEAISFYKTRSVALEGATFSTTNTETGQASTTRAAGYSGPVNYLDTQFIGGAGREAVAGTAFSDFLNTLGGDDAISAGLGDDVLDGGTGSNFLTGGAGWDTFFLDGRGGQVTWGTITDWQAGEHLSLWGWRPGVSRATWEDSAGAAGFRGATLHADLDGNGVIDASVTWSGLARGQLPAPLELDGLLWFK